jgi:hypothetical protein
LTKNTKTKLTVLSKGDNVIIPIPSVDRGPADERNIKGVVMTSVSVILSISDIVASVSVSVSVLCSVSEIAVSVSVLSVDTEFASNIHRIRTRNHGQ